MKIFPFVVRHLRWLSHVPLAPQLFDASLLTWTSLFNRPRLRAMEALESAALQLPAVQPCLHRFGGIGFAHEGREFAHLHGNGLLDINLTRDRATALVNAGVAEPHHVFGPSAWVSFWLHSEKDVAVALSLIELGTRSVGAKKTVTT